MAISVVSQVPACAPIKPAWSPAVRLQAWWRAEQVQGELQGSEQSTIEQAVWRPKAPGAENTVEAPSTQWETAAKKREKTEPWIRKEDEGVRREEGERRRREAEAKRREETGRRSREEEEVVRREEEERRRREAEAKRREETGRRSREEEEEEKGVRREEEERRRREAEAKRRDKDELESTVELKGQAGYANDQKFRQALHETKTVGDIRQMKGSSADGDVEEVLEGHASPSPDLARTKKIENGPPDTDVLRAPSDRSDPPRLPFFFSSSAYSPVTVTSNSSRILAGSSDEEENLLSQLICSKKAELEVAAPLPVLAATTGELLASTSAITDSSVGVGNSALSAKQLSFVDGQRRYHRRKALTGKHRAESGRARTSPIDMFEIQERQRVDVMVLPPTREDSDVAMPDTRQLCSSSHVIERHMYPVLPETKRIERMRRVPVAHNTTVLGGRTTRKGNSSGGLGFFGRLLRDSDTKRFDS
ncbi:UNVERIFIED_CONTAM: hypothetical protein HHA_455040 [Hammondia hammondi]|eukprot:XP_008888788.1 hypothetical protein HHA_455040 [Hammondia hammondi]